MQQRTEKAEDRVKALARIPFFAHLSSESLHLLAERLVRRHFEPGQMIFSEGQTCEGLYVIESGSVKLYKLSKNGREQIVATHGPGQILSDLALIDGECHPFSASALAKSTLFFASTEILKAVCPNEPACAHQMVNIVAARLRDALGMIEELSFSTVRARLAAYLLRTASRRSLQNGSVVKLPINQEIAADIGTVRELVSRHLGRLQTNGVIRITGRTMQVVDVDALVREAAAGSSRKVQRRRSRRSALLSTVERTIRPSSTGNGAPAPAHRSSAEFAGLEAGTSAPQFPTEARHSA